MNIIQSWFISKEKVKLITLILLVQLKIKPLKEIYLKLNNLLIKSLLTTNLKLSITLILFKKLVIILMMKILVVFIVLPFFIIDLILMKSLLKLLNGNPKMIKNFMIKFILMIIFLLFDFIY